MLTKTRVSGEMLGKFRILASLLFLVHLCQVIHEWDQPRLKVTYLKTALKKWGAFCLSMLWDLNWFWLRVPKLEAFQGWKAEFFTFRLKSVGVEAKRQEIKQEIRLSQTIIWIPRPLPAPPVKHSPLDKGDTHAYCEDAGWEKSDYGWYLPAKLLFQIASRQKPLNWRPGWWTEPRGQMGARNSQTQGLWVDKVFSPRTWMGTNWLEACLVFKRNILWAV